MSAQLLEGQPVSDAVLKDVSRRLRKLKDRGRIPGLGTILVGDDAPSAGYVRKKHEACRDVGFKSFDRHLPTTTSQKDLLHLVQEFNENPEVDGFLIQYPIPSSLDYEEAVQSMDPDKDADGLHPSNLGNLVLQKPGPIPATPAGIQAMLMHYDIPIEGKEVVIVGRGPTLGRPLALLLSLKSRDANAAITVVHSAIPDVADYTRRAMVVIAAAGVPGIVTKDMIQPGAVVISGGITWKGKRLVPDVDEAVAEVAGWITPRLGGVGPTTIAMLMRNTLQCAESRAG